MNNLITKNFKGQEIVFKEIDGQHMVRVDEVAKFCGWTYTKEERKNKEFTRWNTINKHLVDLGVSQEVATGDFIPEFVMYALIGKAKNAAATEFMLWVGQTLTELRTKGVVILDHAEDETIDFEKKFGKYRIRRTFTESQDLRQDWEQLKELSKAENKAKRLTGSDRIKLYNIAFSAVSDRLNSGLTELRGSELMALQELLTDIKSDTLELSNRVNGGKKSGLTKRLNAATEQLEEYYEYIDKIVPSAEEYHCLYLHGFSVNSQYTPNIDRFGNLKLKRTASYNQWLNKFKTEMDKLGSLDINFDNEVDVYLYFDHMERFDCHNFQKSIFDALSKHFDVDDSCFHLKLCDTNEYVDSYEDGKIYFCIRERESLKVA